MKIKKERIGEGKNEEDNNGKNRFFFFFLKNENSVMIKRCEREKKRFADVDVS